jgi:hypothetical protein
VSDTRDHKSDGQQHDPDDGHFLLLFDTSSIGGGHPAPPPLKDRFERGPISRTADISCQP